MGESAALARLDERLRGSQARLAVVAPLLPAGLGARVGAGSLDADGWTLLADSAAVAAKLRQCVPNLEAAIAGAGLLPTTVRVKVKRG